MTQQRRWCCFVSFWVSRWRGFEDIDGYYASWYSVRVRVWCLGKTEDQDRETFPTNSRPSTNRNQQQSWEKFRSHTDKGTRSCDKWNVESFSVSINPHIYPSLSEIVFIFVLLSFRTLQRDGFSSEPSSTSSVDSNYSCESAGKHDCFISSACLTGP